MVYNAMKLFMEINPQLFDDCSHDYNEHQNNADKREEARKEKWAKLQSQADKMKQGLRPVQPPNSDTIPNVGGIKLDDESATASVYAQTTAVEE